ncbi:MAG: hypothetical protein VXB01_02575 [Opitutae bacterium]
MARKTQAQLAEKMLAPPKQPKRFSVTEAKGGFIIDGKSYEDEPVVAKTIEDVIKELRSRFDSKG